MPVLRLVIQNYSIAFLHQAVTSFPAIVAPLWILPAFLLHQECCLREILPQLMDGIHMPTLYTVLPPGSIVFMHPKGLPATTINIKQPQAPCKSSLSQSYSPPMP